MQELDAPSTTEPITSNVELPPGVVIKEVTISENTFPDTNFRKYVSEQIDKDGNGILDKSEIAGTSAINVDGMGITDMTGIGYFVMLTMLYCESNQISSLDMSNNSRLVGLICSSNRIVNLNVNQNYELMGLNCSNNSLSSINLNANGNLMGLDCSNNNITELNIKSNPGLIGIDCSNNNISKLDISMNSKLPLENIGCD